ncbi:MAG: acyl--CoA ligase [Bacteroidales bacterium]|nr:acyl--CoA ligase [Bacteroidales bacterium]
MKSFYELFKEASVCYPDSAIHFPDEGKKYSYSEFLEGVDEYAGAMTGCGIGRGDRVALFGQNTSYWMKCFFALLKIGAVAVPISSKCVEDEILYMTRTAGVKLLFHFMEGPVSARLIHSVPAVVTLDRMDAFVHDYRRNRQENELPAFEPERTDLLMIMFTSGTTADPKGVMHGPESLMNSATDFMKTIGLDSGDVMLLNLPISHIYGSVLICCSFFMAGADLVVSRTYTARGTLNLINKYRCTVLNMVPTMYQLLFSPDLVRRYDLSSVRRAIVGGSYTSQELVDNMGKAFGKENVMCGFGMTECASWALGQGFDRPAAERGTSAGWPVGNMEARIAPGYGLSEDGMIQGELCLRGKGMMLGYLDATITAASYDDEGWFHTGDVAKKDQTGKYWIVDRCKDMIIRGGENISPKHVELVIDSFEGIEGSQVVGLRDAVFGEKVVAVLLKDQAAVTDIKALISYLRQRLGKNRRPDFYVAMSEIPMAGVGKVNKQAIRSLVDANIGKLKRNTINYLG